MKHLFLIIGVLLLAMAIGTVMTEPDLTSEVPVIYWMTDANPARYEQIALFHEWLVENGHTTPEGKAIAELRLDTANSDQTKKIVQSVAGVAADIMDADIARMRELGVLEDVTEDALRLNFDPSVTYSGVRSLLEFEGRQYGFPCNVATTVLWANADTFKSLGMDTPPVYVDADTFEQIGREYIKRANADNPPKRRFFCESLSGWQSNGMLTSMLRSTGLDLLNETMTKSELDDPRFVEILERFYRWTYVDNLMPTAAQESSFAAEAGYGGGSGLALFQTGQYGIIMRGRWGLIRVRQFENPPNLSVSLPPHMPDGMINTTLSARSAAVYKGGKHKEIAKLFLAFLASEKYSQQIVDSADALPPLPALAEDEEFIKPKDFPNEWGTHEIVSHAAANYGIPEALSAFVPMSYIMREVSIARDHVMTNNRVKTPQQAAADCARAINLEISRDIEEDPDKQVQYDELVAIQEKIEAYREANRKVPLEWITNPFYKRYYVEMGWSDLPSEQVTLNQQVNASSNQIENESSSVSSPDANRQVSGL